MKRTTETKSVLRKAVAMALSFMMILPLIAHGGALFPSASAAECDCASVPVIYVHGHQPIYKTGENGEKIELFTDDDEALAAAVKEILPVFLKAVTLGTDGAWQEYSDRFLELFPPFVEDIAPNPDGTPRPGTGVDFSWTPASLSSNHRSMNANEYVFIYDYRVSLFDEAAKLNDYIEAVKEKTGHDKVVLMSRCGGTNLAAAYLSVYQKPIGYSGIKKVIFLSGNLLGADFMDAILSGTARFNSEAFYRWLKSYDLADMVGEEIAGYLYTALDAIEATAGGTEGVCELLNRLYEKIKDTTLAPFLKACWGVNAGFVAFVNDHYEQYKSYIFSEEGDLEKYAAVIGYLDRYHYDVQEHTEEDLLAMRAAGVEVDTVVYYGDQAYPLTESASLTSDTVTSVADQSYGGTASALTGTLSPDYIAARQNEGKGKYISADRQIDASTGLLPDTTWYVKNAHHVFHHGAIDRFLMVLARTDGITVDTLSAWPQFLNYDGETQTFAPLAEQNGSDTDWNGMEEQAQKTGITNLLRLLIDFFQRLIDRFMELVNHPERIFGFLQG